MRAFKLALTAVIALSAVMPAHADPLGPKMRPSGSPSGVARDGNSGPRPTAPAGGSGDWHRNPGHSSQWGGDWGRPRSTPNHLYGFWGPPEAWGVPYIGWGVPFVPYRYCGDWGALWYPYAEWRGPHGGWGNP